MKLKSFANQLSGTVSSLSLLQVFAVLLMGAFALSMFFPAAESVAGDCADDAADIIAGVAIVAGGVAAIATAPLTTTIALTVAGCAGAYAAGYHIVGLFTDRTSS